ncbi:ATP-binding protein [Spirillospora sp. NPDC029432]|uniref:ATP-binding protein n=1 Tax=Spirillospora sp. NPDC029432 TaxID=3154599 RepID=UPI00345414A6
MTASITGRPVVVRELLATKASVGLARSIVAAFLRVHGLVRYEERALAIVSELVTNAVAVSRPTGTVRVYGTVEPARLWLAVSDAFPERDPAPRNAVSTVEEIDAAGSEEFGGWGLMLVRAYADRVWVERPAGGGRKWVCASIDVAGPGAGATRVGGRGGGGR